MSVRKRARRVAATVAMAAIKSSTDSAEDDDATSTASRDSATTASTEIDESTSTMIKQHQSCLATGLSNMKYDFFASIHEERMSLAKISRNSTFDALIKNLESAVAAAPTAEESHSTYSSVVSAAQRANVDALEVLSPECTLIKAIVNIKRIIIGARVVRSLAQKNRQTCNVCRGQTRKALVQCIKSACFTTDRTVRDAWKKEEEELDGPGSREADNKECYYTNENNRRVSLQLTMMFLMRKDEQPNVSKLERIMMMQRDDVKMAHPLADKSKKKKEADVTVNQLSPSHDFPIIVPKDEEVCEKVKRAIINLGEAAKVYGGGA